VRFFSSCYQPLFIFEQLSAAGIRRQLSAVS